MIYYFITAKRVQCSSSHFTTIWIWTHGQITYCHERKHLSGDWRTTVGEDMTQRDIGSDQTCKISFFLHQQDLRLTIFTPKKSNF